MSALIANARMYAANSEVADAWRALFTWLSKRSGVPLTYLDYAAPAPLESLWSRDDLGVTFMCGLPFASANPRPRIIAAPVPSPPRYDAKAHYCTDFVVRAESPFRRLSDTFGQRIGWTVEHSQSGYNAVRNHLSLYQQDRFDSVFEWVGPLMTPRRVIEAVFSGAIDVGPLDSYMHELLRRHEPSTASRLRTIESTAMTPIPPLIASRSTPVAVAERLRDILVLETTAPDVASILQSLSIKGFVEVDPTAYDHLVRNKCRRLLP